jgi:hypothetical protein
MEAPVMAFPSRNRCQAFRPCDKEFLPNLFLSAPKDYRGCYTANHVAFILPRLRNSLELSNLEKLCPWRGVSDKPSLCCHANEASSSYLTMLGNGNGMLQGSDRMLPNAFMSGTPWGGTGPRHSMPIATLSLFFLSTFSTSVSRAVLTFQISPNHSSRSSCCSTF